MLLQIFPCDMVILISDFLNVYRYFCVNKWPLFDFHPAGVYFHFYDYLSNDNLIRLQNHVEEDILFATRFGFQRLFCLWRCVCISETTKVSASLCYALSDSSLEVPLICTSGNIPVTTYPIHMQGALRAICHTLAERSSG